MVFLVNESVAVGVRRINLATQLLLLPFCSVGLVHLVLNLAHTFSFLNTEFLALLVPAPLVDLSLRQLRLLGDGLQGLLRPMRVMVKLAIQTLKLFSRLSFTLTDETLESASLLIEVKASSGLVLNLRFLFGWLLRLWLVPSCTLH